MSSSTRRHVLVAGGAGYIGSHVCLRLHAAGYTPVVIDDLSAGHEWAVRWGPLVEGDIGDENLVRQVCRDYSPIALMNFAAFTDVAWSVSAPQAFHENNVVKAGRLFSAARDAGIRHVVFSSTAAVYGVPGEDGTVHEQTRLQPSNPYGESKILAERALEALDMSAVVLRYFNAAGAAPPEHGIGEAHWPETNLVPRVILAALGIEGEISVFGHDYPTPDGTAIRDYIHVSDLAEAHLAALEYLLKGGESVTLNLGTGQGHSVLQVIESVQRHTGRVFQIRKEPPRPGDIPVMIANADRSREVLGWTAQYDLDDIIASAVAWHDGAAYRAMLPVLKSATRKARRSS